MNIAWRGPTDLTFHRLTRTQILSQIDWIRENTGTYTTSEIFRIDRFGKRQAIVKVKELDNGIFVYPFDVNDKTSACLVGMAPLMGSDMKVLNVDEFYNKLKDGMEENVWLQFPADGPKTVIGKVLAVKAGEHLMVSLTPVPKDIEAINEKARQMCANLGCQKAAEGLQCGACDKLNDCSILTTVNGMLIQEKEN